MWEIYQLHIIKICKLNRICNRTRLTFPENWSMSDILSPTLLSPSYLINFCLSASCQEQWKCTRLILTVLKGESNS